MSTPLTDSQLSILIDNSISNLQEYLLELKSDEDPRIIKKSSLISYWVKDYTNYLSKEKTLILVVLLNIKEELSFKLILDIGLVVSLVEDILPWY